MIKQLSLVEGALSFVQHVVPPVTFNLHGQSGALAVTALHATDLFQGNIELYCFSKVWVSDQFQIFTTFQQS